MQGAIKKETVDREDKLLARLVKQMDKSAAIFCDRMMVSLVEQEGHWNRRFDTLEASLQDAQSALHNAKAVFKNGTLRRLHREITPLQVRREKQYHANLFEWKFHP